MFSPGSMAWKLLLGLDAVPPWWCLVGWLALNVHLLSTGCRVGFQFSAVVRCSLFSWLCGVTIALQARWCLSLALVFYRLALLFSWFCGVVIVLWAGWCFSLAMLPSGFTDFISLGNVGGGA